MIGLVKTDASPTNAEVVAMLEERLVDRLESIIVGWQALPLNAFWCWHVKRYLSSQKRIAGLVSRCVLEISPNRVQCLTDF